MCAHGVRVARPVSSGRVVLQEQRIDVSWGRGYLSERGKEEEEGKGLCRVAGRSFGNSGPSPEWPTPSLTLTLGDGGPHEEIPASP